ncbi:MFS transporter [Pleurocapsales cyanobacterium LEGE 06147]|nr:MFS transporter [Pleurocapsales cyanobacterium LEGE 06147]
MYDRSSRHIEEADLKQRLKQHQRFFGLLSVVAGSIFFQGYMIAPLIPRFSEVFQAPAQQIGLVIPAYMLTYALTGLFYGILSDRFGRWSTIRASLIIFILATAMTATAQSAWQLLFWRLLTGLGASGAIPLAIALIGDLFPFEQRGSAIGLLFAAMEGGMALGSTGGAILEPFVGWQMLFVLTASTTVVILWRLRRYGALFDRPHVASMPSVKEIFVGYYSLLSTGRGKRTYVYIFLNAIFHSGVYTWLGLYLSQRYELGELGIGLAILGYGIPGFLFSNAIGRAADKWGRKWLIPPGLGIAAIATAVMIFQVPLSVVIGAIAILSLGYDLTQPLFAAIVTDLGGSQSLGQRMGLTVFTLFAGFGIGGFIFGEVLRLGFGPTLAIFSIVQLLATIAAIPLFRSEIPK